MFWIYKQGFTDFSSLNLSNIKKKQFFAVNDTNPLIFLNQYHPCFFFTNFNKSKTT